MATYFSCLALSFFGLQRAEKEKKNKTGVQTVMLTTRAVTYHLWHINAVFNPFT